MIFNKALIMTSLNFLVLKIKSKAVWYTHRKHLIDVRIIQPLCIPICDVSLLY